MVMESAYQEVRDFILRSASVSRALQDICQNDIHAHVNENNICSFFPDIRSRLKLRTDEQISYRSVCLYSHETELVCAEIWYRGELLSAPMRDELAKTDRPFGIVVSPLGVTRNILSVAEEDGPCIFSCQAVLLADNEKPLAFVCERFLDNILSVAARGNNVLFRNNK